MTKKILLSLATALCLSSATALAQDAYGSRGNRSVTDGTMTDYTAQKPHFGLMGGITNPEGRYGSTGEYGLDVGYQFDLPFMTSAELTYSEPESDDGDRISRTTLLAKGLYSVGGDIPLIRDSYLGVGVGPVFTDEGTDFAAAPILGFDIPLAGTTSMNDDGVFSLGANAKYMVISGDDPDALSVNGVVKYWY